MRSRVIHATLLGTPFRFEAAAGLFSQDRVDDGTALLLANLPARAPARVLDMGCGYGALSLPVAARFPHAAVTLVDRALLAVECAQRNATSHALENVTAYGSLGYRDLAVGVWDWVLCNIPARIGAAGIGYLMEEGASRLVDGGELRVVVIQDLAPTVRSLALARAWPLQQVATGPRYEVFALPKCGAPAADHESLYALDRVMVQGIETPLSRPHDIGEEPAHRTVGMPLLLECLPKKTQRALCVQAGYGAVARTLVDRGAQVTAADGDLLALSFTVRNAPAVKTVAAVRPAEALKGVTFDLVVGEVHTQADPELTVHNMESTQKLLRPGGQALWLMHAKFVKHAPKGGVVLAKRGTYAVWRMGAVFEKT